MHIDASHHGGNIQLFGVRDDTHLLKIRWDSRGQFRQWFSFRTTGSPGEVQRFSIVNASRCSYPKAWENYRVVASHDREHWFRVTTSYDGQALHFEHAPTAAVTWYAYFAPFDEHQHAQLLADACKHEGVQAEVVATTPDGRPVDLLKIGRYDEPSAPVLWVIARQHPGETMAEHWMQGFLDALLDDDHETSRMLRTEAAIYVVPNMNPDGSARGNLRTNANGVNLNREWSHPTEHDSPEVHGVRARMLSTGCHVFLDVHGDEELPYVFLSAAEGVPSFDDRLGHLQKVFSDAYLQASPDFQDVHGYKKDAPGQANLSIASNWAAEHFRTLAVTLEMPFSDNANAPDAEVGWSPARCRELGAAAINPLLAALKAVNEG